VAMPTVLSVTMAVGARLLRKRSDCNALACHRGTAGVDVLCSDKTAHYPETNSPWGDPFSVDGIAPDKVILWAASLRAETKTPSTSRVIGGVKDDKELKSFQVLHFQPFIRCNKRTEATSRSGWEQFLCGQRGSAVNSAAGNHVGEVKALPWRRLS